MLPTLDRALTAVEELLNEELDARALCVLWIDLVEFRKNVDTAVRSVEEEATEKLHEEFGDDANGKPITGKRTMFF